MPLEPSADKLIQRMTKAGWVTSGTIIEIEGAVGSGKIGFSKEAGDKLERLGAIFTELEINDDTLGPIELYVLRILALDVHDGRQKNKGGDDNGSRRL